MMAQQREVLFNLLEQQFKDQKIIRGVEIGILKGELDFYLLERIPNLHMWSVDPKPLKRELFEVEKERKDA